MSASSPVGIGAGRARLRRRLRLAVAGGVVLLGLLAAELALRLFAPAPGQFEVSLFVPDPDPLIGYRMRPGLRARVRWTGSDEPMEVAINGWGMRDPERPREKPPGVRRVMVLGDSFTHGAVPREQGFCAQLEALLGAGHEVWNTGVPGWATREQAAWFARDGRGFAPDAVVLAFFVGNDLLENQRQRQQEVQDGELVSRRSFWRQLRNRSRLYRLLKALPERLSCALSGDSLAARRYHEEEAERLRVCAPDADQRFAEGWRAAAEGLRAIREAAKPLPLVVLAIPDEVQVDPALLRAVCARTGEDPARFQLGAPQARLAALCRELELPLIDPLEELRARTAAGQAQYLPLDSHWNARANQLAAERLAAALRPLLAP